MKSTYEVTPSILLYYYVVIRFASVWVFLKLGLTDASTVKDDALNFSRNNKLKIKTESAAADESEMSALDLGHERKRESGIE